MLLLGRAGKGLRMTGAETHCEEGVENVREIEKRARDEEEGGEKNRNV